MPGKKAKSPPKVSKAASKAPKTAQKTAQKTKPKAMVAKAGSASKSIKTAGAATKGGTLGSIKKMLGLGAKKGAAPVKGNPTVAVKKTQAVAPAPKNGKAAAVVKTAAPQSKPQVVTKPEPAPKARKGANKGGVPAPLTTLSLKPQSERHDGHGPAVCREVACELMANTGHYCRMHYIKNWKKIKRKEIILKEKKLNHYIEELVSKYPDKYIEAIRQDLASEKDFAKVVADLEIDEGLDDFESVETESAEGIIDNLKRDFEDEGDVF